MRDDETTRKNTAKDTTVGALREIFQQPDAAIEEAVDEWLSEMIVTNRLLAEWENELPEPLGEQFRKSDQALEIWSQLKYELASSLREKIDEEIENWLAMRRQDGNMLREVLKRLPETPGPEL